MHDVKELDEILRGLPTDCYTKRAVVTDQLENYRYLESLGLINLIKRPSESIPKQIVLTREGLKFINEGGFYKKKQDAHEEETDRMLQRENWVTTTKTAKWAIWIAVASAFISLVALLKSC